MKIKRVVTQLILINVIERYLIQTLFIKEVLVILLKYVT
jgi:hypothetical protein